MHFIAYEVEFSKEFVFEKKVIVSRQGNSDHQRQFVFWTITGKADHYFHAMIQWNDFKGGSPLSD